METLKAEQIMTQNLKFRIRGKTLREKGVEKEHEKNLCDLGTANQGPYDWSQEQRKIG